MNTMTRTIFWNDATFCVVKFDPTIITSARILCEILGKPLNVL